MSELIKMYCQNCGGELEISTDKDYCYCTYCGTKLLIPAERKFVHIKKDININQNTTNRIIDEAKITKEQEKTKRQSNSKEMLEMILTIIVGFGGIALMYWMFKLH